MSYHELHHPGEFVRIQFPAPVDSVRRSVYLSIVVVVVVVVKVSKRRVFKLKMLSRFSERIFVGEIDKIDLF